MRRVIQNMPPLLAVALLTAGCLSPHGGLCFPFSGEPKPQINAYTGGGDSYQTAYQVRRVKEASLPYLEDSWASYNRYRTASHDEVPSLESFRRNVTRKTERVDGKVYHVLTFLDADGRPQIAYFDVTGIVHE